MKQLQLISLLILLTTTQELTQDVTPRDKIIQLLRRRATLLDDLGQPRKLLTGILLVLANLLGNLDIVLRGLVLRTLDALLDITNQVREVTCRNVLANERVQVGDCAGLLVQTTSNGTVGAGLGVQEVNEGLLRACALVGFGVVGALGKELDGGEAGDALFAGESLCVLSFSVDLRDHDAGFEDVVVGEGFPGRSKALAV